MAASSVPRPVAISRILAATDFSPCADHALSCALALTRQWNAKIFILHVLGTASDSKLSEIALDIETDRRQAEKNFRTLANSGVLKSVDYSILIRRGHLCDVLPGLVGMYQIDLVVIGTHGHTGLKKMLLGSVAEQVCRVAPCPAMTIGLHAGLPGSGLPFTRILYATDFLSGSLRAAPLAFSLAEKAQGAVTLLNVIEEGGHRPSAAAESAAVGIHEKLRKLLPTHSAFHVSLHILVPFGPPAEIILRVAEEERSDLIIMGMRPVREAALATHLPKAVAPYVISHAHCPVLTVHG
ncbi:MAG: universal stress protein [Candidatus Korobacteraceae bacterium]